MRKYPTFYEYLNAKGALVEKPVIDPSADQLDMPKPTAKDDPHQTNKTVKGKHDQVAEYLNAKGTLVDAPSIETVPDYDGPDDKAPPGGGANYKATGTPKAAAKGENGFGNMGEKSLKYNPANDSKKEKTVATWPKTTTEAFLEKTKGMSMAEFTRFMLEDCGCGVPQAAEDLPFVTAYSTGKIQPHPPEAIKYVVVLANKNDEVLGNLVHEIKGSGGLSKLLKTVLAHPEAYDELVGLMGDDNEGPNIAGSLARAMHSNFNKFLMDQEGMYESVAPPIGLDDEEEEGFGDNSFEEEPEDDHDMEGMDDEDHDDAGDDSDMDDIPHHAKPQRKLKKKFAWNHMLDAMKKYGLH